MKAGLDGLLLLFGSFWYERAFILECVALLTARPPQYRVHCSGPDIVATLSALPAPC